MASLNPRMDADLWPFHAFPWTSWILRRILWTGGNQTCALRLRTCAGCPLSPPLSPLSPPSAIIGIASCLPFLPTSRYSYTRSYPRITSPYRYTFIPLLLARNILVRAPCFPSQHIASIHSYVRTQGKRIPIPRSSYYFKHTSSCLVIEVSTHVQPFPLCLPITHEFSLYTPLCLCGSYH